MASTYKRLTICVLLFAFSQVDFGSATTRVELRVSDVNSTNSRQKTIAVREGEPFELTCEADVDDSPILLKYRGLIFNSSRPGVSWIIEKLTRPNAKEVLLGKLKIENVTLHDSGVYQCRPEFDLFDDKTVSVQVKVTKAKALQISAGANQSYIVTGNDTNLHLSLRCNGEHGASPTWYVDGSQLEEGLSVDKKVMTTITVVASRDDNIRQSWLTRQADQPVPLQGRYQCVDVNHYMSDSVELVVSGAISQTVVSSLPTLLVVFLATFWVTV